MLFIYFVLMRETTKELYKDIRQAYQDLSNIKEHGVQKHSDAWIRKTLAKKFYKNVSTIEAIIFHRV